MFSGKVVSKRYLSSLIQPYSFSSHFLSCVGYFMRGRKKNPSLILPPIIFFKLVHHPVPAIENILCILPSNHQKIVVRCSRVSQSITGPGPSFFLSSHLPTVLSPFRSRTIPPSHPHADRIAAIGGISLPRESNKWLGC